jgi:6-phosphogluconolactonase
MTNARAGEFFIYVGTITARESKGLYLYRFDTATVRLEAVGLVAELPYCTYLTLHPQGRFLYAVSEVREPDGSGRRESSVNAFSIAPETGRLTFLNRQSSGGVGPCYVTLDHTGRFLLVSNYVSGSAAILPIQRDGHLAEPTGVVQHHGSSINPKRQSEPHAHSINPSPDNRFALVADLGIDRIMVYRLDLAAGRLLPNDSPYAALKPGSGPRHLAFHPSRSIVYVINELGSTMTVFAWDAARGALREMDTLSTLPTDFRAESWCADVHAALSGKFLYGSNRGHDSIAIFRIEEPTGALTPIGHQSALGIWPRNFTIDPTGTWMVAANTGLEEGRPVAAGVLDPKDESIVVFRVDPVTGRLSPTGQKAEMSVPACVKILPRG